ncbi:MAG TPA: alpha/beta fold hydrolase [Candidatus Saccharimonadales bacterium]|nr:alpha/beta fold hydrolase [Candidatus Saccharimonadales bacterium]
MGAWKGEGAPREVLPLANTSLESAGQLPEVPEEDSGLRLGERVRYFLQAARYAVLGGLAADIDAAKRLGPDEEPERFGRREFLRRSKTAAGNVGAVVLLAQYGRMAEVIHKCAVAVAKAEDKAFAEDIPKFTLLENRKYKDEKEFAVYLPGFGDQASGDEARAWMIASGLLPAKPNSSTGEELLMGFMDYSQSGASIKQMADLIRAQIDVTKVELITIVGRSMGGLLAWALAAELGIPVKCITMISSPGALSDGEFGVVGNVIAPLPESAAIATLAKWGVSMYRDIEHHGLHPEKNTERSYHETMTGQKPTGLQEELKIMQGVDLDAPDDSEFFRKLLKVIIPNFTRVAYARTHNPPSDETVNVVSAVQRIIRFCKRLSIIPEIANVPYDGHANVVKSGEYLIEWTQDALSPDRVLAAG